MGNRRTAELVLARDGQWVIIYPDKGAMTRVSTGQVDPALADLDFAAWKRTGALDPAAQLWPTAAKKLQNSVLQRNRGASLGKVAIQTKLMEQGYVCAVTGRSFELVNTGRRQPWQPSVDRRESSRGYEPDNIRITCLIVNMALGAWGEEPLRELASLLVTPRLTPRIPA